MEDLTFLKNERTALLNLVVALARKNENLDLCVAALQEADFFHDRMLSKENVPNQYVIYNMAMSLIGMTKQEEAEIWMPVVGEEGKYEVSNLGRVRSLDHYRRSGKVPASGNVKKILVKGKYERIEIGSSGYLAVSISSRRKNLHGIVAEAFLGPRPEGMFVLHNDGNKRNPRLSNLRYGTQSENIADAKLHGTRQSGENISSAQMCNMSAAFVRAMSGTWSQRKMAIALGVAKPTISYAKTGLRFENAPIISKEEAISWYIDKYGKDKYDEIEKIIDSRSLKRWHSKDL